MTLCKSPGARWSLASQENSLPMVGTMNMARLNLSKFYNALQ